MKTIEEFENLIKEDKAIVVVDTNKNEILCRLKGGCRSDRIIRIPKFVNPDISFIAGFLYWRWALNETRFQNNN